MRGVSPAARGRGFSLGHAAMRSGETRQRASDGSSVLPSAGGASSAPVWPCPWTAGLQPSVWRLRRKMIPRRAANVLKCAMKSASGPKALASRSPHGLTALPRFSTSPPSLAGAINPTRDTLPQLDLHSAPVTAPMAGHVAASAVHNRTHNIRLHKPQRPEPEPDGPSSPAFSTLSTRATPATHPAEHACHPPLPHILPPPAAPVGGPERWRWLAPPPAAQAQHRRSTNSRRSAQAQHKLPTVSTGAAQTPDGQHRRSTSSRRLTCSAPAVRDGSAASRARLGP